LEARANKYVWFVTLTYSNDHLPENGTLVKEHYVKFIKKVRHEQSERRTNPETGRLKRYYKSIRYYGVGEYGAEVNTARPHYHFIFFTQHAIHLGKSKRVFDGKAKKWREIYPQNSFSKSWDYGFVDCVPLIGRDDSRKVLRYVAGYSLKKLFKERKDYGKRLPEFATQSRKPGLGFINLDQIVSGLKKHGILPKFIQVPERVSEDYKLNMLRFDGKLWPLSRSFRDKLIEHLGGDHRGIIQKSRDRQDEQIRRLRSPDYDAQEERQKQVEAEHRADKRFNLSQSTRRKI
jgi:hypothetical protein